MGTEMKLLLVVDSSASLVFSTATFLRNLQYKVKTATSAESALQIMTESPPAMVIMDTVLPNMSGIDLLKMMKQNPLLKAIPVIMQTFQADPAVKETCTLAGCAGYLNKPVDPAALYRSIQAVMESTPRQTIRIDLSLKVLVGDETSRDGLKREEEVTTLSEGGLYIKSHVPDPVKTVLPLTLFIRSRIIKATAEVLYSSVKTGGQHKVPGMGLKFVSIADEDRKFIRNFITDRITKNLGSDDTGIRP
jgi:two-component system cell cycle response regulator DivK